MNVPRLLAALMVLAPVLPAASRAAPPAPATSAPSLLHSNLGMDNEMSAPPTAAPATTHTPHARRHRRTAHNLHHGTT